jgi:hypothetical protein
MPLYNTIEKIDRPVRTEPVMVSKKASVPATDYSHGAFKAAADGMGCGALRTDHIPAPWYREAAMAIF